MALTLAKTATKVGLGVGAVYFTTKEGVWSGIDESQVPVDRLKKKVVPLASQYIEKIPSPQQINDTIVDGWNSGVNTTFHEISKAPQYAYLANQKVTEQLRNVSKN